MSVAHGGWYAMAVKTLPGGRKRGKVRAVAVGNDTAVVWARRYGRHDGRRNKKGIGQAALTVLRSLDAVYVDTLSGKSVGERSVKWIDVWRIRVFTHTPQELTRLLSPVSLEHFYGSGREMIASRVLPRRGDNGFTERHLPARARLRGVIKARERLLAANGNLPALLREIGVSMDEIRREDASIPLHRRAPDWRYGIPAWHGMAERLPDFPRLWRLFVRKLPDAMSAMNAARVAYRSAQQSAAPQELTARASDYSAAIGVCKRERYRADVMTEWLESQPPVKAALAADKERPAPKPPAPRIKGDADKTAALWSERDAIARDESLVRAGLPTLAPDERDTLAAELAAIAHKAAPDVATTPAMAFPSAEPIRVNVSPAPTDAKPVKIPVKYQPPADDWACAYQRFRKQGMLPLAAERAASALCPKRKGSKRK